MCKSFLNCFKNIKLNIYNQLHLHYLLHSNFTPHIYTNPICGKEFSNMLKLHHNSTFLWTHTNTFIYKLSY